jgi:hypothetical protein
MDVAAADAAGFDPKLDFTGTGFRFGKVDDVESVRPFEKQRSQCMSLYWLQRSDVLRSGRPPSIWGVVTSQEMKSADGIPAGLSDVSRERQISITG